MKRGAPLRRTKSLNPVSEKRKLENQQRAEAMKIVRKRDGTRCVVGPLWGTPCFGPLHGHEIKSRAQGGSITDPNGIVLCCDKHNEEIANTRPKAESLGLAVPSRW